jgi:hypothetical protein
MYMYIYTNMYVHKYIYIYMYLCAYRSVYACIYIYTLLSSVFAHIVYSHECQLHRAACQERVEISDYYAPPPTSTPCLRTLVGPLGRFLKLRLRYF